MLIDKAGIARLIPHSGAMCLLDGVLSWAATQITCVSTTHSWLGNPMRRGGRIGILCGVEYAAQAMALHAALAGGADAKPRRGYLASLRSVCCLADRLDAIPGRLEVEAEQLLGDGDRVIYGFAVRYEGGILLSGQAAVALEQRMI
ncbi:phosphotransferase [Rhodopila sp.]|uniref:phosphotransferase n=1 Tax=Rhodopila sp. TaxID=2480087 RepID=UPI003D1370D4